MSSSNESRWRTSPSTRQNPSSRPQDRDRTGTPNNSRNQTNNRPSDALSTTSSQTHQSSIVTQPPPPPQNAWVERTRSQTGGRGAPGAPTGPRGSGQGTGLGIGLGNGGPPAPQAAGAGAAEEKHVSVSGFNGEEIREYMRKSLQDAIAGDTTNSHLYRASADQSSTSGTPSNSTSNATARPAWGAKPGAMANGQEFVMHLRKQILAVEQGRGG